MSIDGAIAYMQAVLATQQKVMDTQREPLDRAATIMENAIRQGGRILLFGSGHSHMLAEEGHYRAGGLAPVVPILQSALMLHESAISSSAFERMRGYAKPLLARYQPEGRDCIMVFSNSGVNAVPVEMAQAAHEAGMQVIAVVALAYATQAAVGPVGVRLTDVADVILDNGAPEGDCLLPLEGAPGRTGPFSTVGGALVMNLLRCEVAQRLADRGIEPVFLPSHQFVGSRTVEEQLEHFYAQYARRVAPLYARQGGPS